MAVDQLLSTMPQITLEPQYILQFEAINPSTGAAVTGVTVGNASITTLQVASFGEAQAVPLWIPLPTGDQ
jgi:hypothetical protein